MIVEKVYNDTLLFIHADLNDPKYAYEVELYNKIKSVNTLIRAKRFRVLEDAAQWAAEQIAEITSSSQQ